jgi:outer membrane receptor protein involved in Fe transport
VTSTGFVDPLTGGNNSLRLISRGNADLIPEEARTITLGLVYVPEFIPRFSIAVDYYDTEIDRRDHADLVPEHRGAGPVHASGPAFDSPFCSLAIRPISDPTDPNYRNPNLNFPTEILNAPLNAAQQKIHGYDLQIDYNFDMFGGQFAIRHLARYQPETPS